MKENGRKWRKQRKKMKGKCKNALLDISFAG
jgi:hypothetical protein